MQYATLLPVTSSISIGNTTLPYYFLKDEFNNLFKETCLNYHEYGIPHPIKNARCATRIHNKDSETFSDR